MFAFVICNESWTFGSRRCGQNLYIDRENAVCVNETLFFSTTEDKNDSLECPLVPGVMLYTLDKALFGDVHVYRKEENIWKVSDLYNYCGYCDVVRAEYHCADNNAAGSQYYFVIADIEPQNMPLCVIDEPVEKSDPSIIIDSQYSGINKQRCEERFHGSYVATNKMEFAISLNNNSYCPEQLETAAYYCRAETPSLASCGEVTYFQWCRKDIICLFDERRMISECGLLPFTKDELANNEDSGYSEEFTAFSLLCELSGGYVLWDQENCYIGFGSLPNYQQAQRHYEYCHICVGRPPSPFKDKNSELLISVMISIIILVLLFDVAMMWIARNTRIGRIFRRSVGERE